MQLSRFVRAAAGAATRIRAAQSYAAASQRVLVVPRRSLCTKSTSPSKTDPAPASNTSVTAKSGEAKPIVETAEAIKPNAAPESSNLGEATKPAGEVASATAAPDAAGVKAFPDVPSTSLGLGFAADPQTNDPLKWKKFAYKYVGAVLVFLISYKTLHWYVDGLAKDGKRQREEVEENKEILREINAPKEANVGIVSNAAPVVVATKTVENSTGASVVANTDADVPQMRIFDQVKEEAPNVVSELEELYVYKIELETKRRDLEADKKSSDVRSQKEDISTELKALENDIEMLEQAEKKKANS